MSLPASGPAYAELSASTSFSFLRGASQPGEMVVAAAALGLVGIGIADRNSVAGVVRAHVVGRMQEIRDAGLRVVAGARLVFADGTPDILAYPATRAGWAHLCRLLTRGNGRAEKGGCLLHLDDLLEEAGDLLLAVLPEGTADPSEQRPLRAGDTRWAGPAPASELDAEPANRPRLRVVGGMEPVPEPTGDPLDRVLARLRGAAPGRLWLAARMAYHGQDARRLAVRARLAARHGLPLLAVNEPLMHGPERRPLADVLACIRLRTTLEVAGTRLAPHAERHLKGAREMARLFGDQGHAVAETVRFLDRIAFSLDELGHDYPEETRDGFPDAQSALVAYTREGAAWRYPAGVPPRVAAQVGAELDLIARKGYAPYFLTVHDIVRFARSRGILCQGRGSAANSAVCYCLRITEIDPATSSLLFERFISGSRDEAPDIDVDFEHGRREEVIQYVYARYGRHRAALAASVIVYRAKSAIREVGRAFGLSGDVVAGLAGSIWGWSEKAIKPEEAARLGLDPARPDVARLLGLVGQVMGLPRHLSQHTGGFVITRTRLDETVPLLNAAMPGRTTVEWDKDDLDALGLMKVDVLALGMLTCLSRAFELGRRHYGEAWTIADMPKDDPDMFAMICRADTMGVFQIESRAQMSMLPRLRPAEYYDLVIEVAIVRPGPIQGDMVHPYLRRREKREEVSYPLPELKAVLKRTLGVPLFQEQAMRIAMDIAGFDSGEIDGLRRAMAAFRHGGHIEVYENRLVEGMVAKGCPRDFAMRCFRQIKGFGEYGFPESHAASFAILVNASAWIKCHYPDVFLAALLNSQPMGFYAPSQLVRDAREHGVRVLEVDVNYSGWDCTLVEDDWDAARLDPRHASMRDAIRTEHAVRLGLRHIEGLQKAEAMRLVERRGDGYDSVRDLWLRGGLERRTLERLAEADGFGSLGLTRREALSAVTALDRVGGQDALPLFAHAGRTEEPDLHLPPMPLGQEVVEDYRSMLLSLKGHPVGFLRLELEAYGVVPSSHLARLAPPEVPPAPRRPGTAYPADHVTGRRGMGRPVQVAGLVLVRQRPGSAHGVLFMTLEDETGTANIIVWPSLFERYRPVVLGARLVEVRGRLQAQAGVLHVVAESLHDRTHLMARIAGRDGRMLDPLLRADEGRHPQSDPHEGSRVAMKRRVQDADILPKGRNFQ